MLRAVVETNVWVSSLLNPSGYPARIRSALAEKRFILLMNEPLLAELAEVLARPRLARKYGITPDDIGEMLL